MRERKLSRSKNSIPDMFVLIVFAVFAVAVITVLSLGISSYQKLVAENDISYQERTCVQYIYSKLQHADDKNRVYAENYADGTALVIEEDFEGEIYYTKIYVYDGWLCESFSADQDGIVPESFCKFFFIKLCVLATSIPLMDSYMLLETSCLCKLPPISMLCCVKPSFCE